MLIFPECGHFIQEDAPEKLADALIEFWKHNQPLVIKKFPIPLKK
jgi:protein phosphatase methylesterase 1